MPYKMKKKSSGDYEVTSPSGKKSKGTTKKKAEAQIRLLNAVEHGWTPTKGKKKKAKSSRSKY